MTATYVADHSDRAVDALPTQFSGKEKLEALVRAIVDQVQAIEDAQYDVLVNRSIDTATGTTLTALGNLVGQPRNGVTDDEIYRRYVRAKIAVNKSNGTIEDVITVSRLVVDDADAYHQVVNTGAAALVLRVVGSAVAATTADLLIEFLRKTVSGGVRIILESSEYATGLLQFDVGPGLDVGRFYDARD